MACSGVVVAVAFSRDNLCLMQDALAPAGVKLWAVECPQDALRQESEAQVVLYDTDGPEHWRTALERFRRRWPAVRVVLVSRLADERMWIEVLETGAYDLLMKPFRPMEIFWVVRSALAPRELRLGHAPPAGVLGAAMHDQGAK